MYFLMISAGGALGGLFVAIVCPLLFRTYFELPIAIVAGLPSRGSPWPRTGWNLDEGREFPAVVWLVCRRRFDADGRHRHVRRFPAGTIVERNFYGTLSVVKQFQSNPDTPATPCITAGFCTAFSIGCRSRRATRSSTGAVRPRSPPKYEAIAVDGDTVTLRDGQGNEFEHGSTTGRSRSREIPSITANATRSPTTFPTAASAWPRCSIRGRRRRNESAVIGLGTGTMAAHGQAGDSYRFYDIDPKVVAMSDKYFTYRSLSPAKSETVLGDARIQMEREAPQGYDLIVLDAFTGDAIPGHLLTVEAFCPVPQASEAGRRRQSDRNHRDPHQQSVSRPGTGRRGARPALRPAGQKIHDRGRRKLRHGLRLDPGHAERKVLAESAGRRLGAAARRPAREGTPLDGSAASLLPILK